MDEGEGSRERVGKGKKKKYGTGGRTEQKSKQGQQSLLPFTFWTFSTLEEKK